MSEPTIQELIERSSLGTPAAQRLRDSVPRGLADRVLARVRELEAEQGSCGARNELSPDLACSRPVHPQGTAHVATPPTGGMIAWGDRCSCP